jgi:hypothetical protein
VVAVAALAFAPMVWPTPHRYTTLHVWTYGPDREAGPAVPVAARFNRFTGRGMQGRSLRWTSSPVWLIIGKEA